MSSLLGVTFTWTGTPTDMAGISTNGPVGVPFSCYPVDRYQYFTFAFSQFGDGCPYEYSFNPVYSTCVYTADLYNSQTWGCTWTVPVVSTSIVDGGPYTAPAGVPATITADVQWVTVTSTQQITSTSTSIVDPGAKTITVTASQGAAKLRRVEIPRYEGVTGEEKILGGLGSQKPLDGPANDLALTSFNPAKGTNSTDSWLEDRALCPYTDQIFCGAGCCLDTQACIGDGSVSCCNGFQCVAFDANAPFVDYLHWSWKGFTATSTTLITTTTYSTVNPPGKTVTVDGPTSTTNIDFFVTKVVTTMVTSTDATITITKFPANAAGPSQGVGGPANNGGSAITVTVGGQSSAAAILNSSSSGKSSSNLGLKVGVGVGVPFAIAILAALLFLIFRRRKDSTAPPLPTHPETSANNPNAGAVAVGGRPVSELPPYTASTMAAAGLANKPGGSLSSAPVSPGSDLPERNYSMNGFYPQTSQSPPPQGQGGYGRSQAGSPPPQSMYSAQGSPPQQMAQVYVPPAGYQGQEMYAGQPPQQHGRVGSMGYSPQSAVSAQYPPQNPGYSPQGGGPQGAAYPPQNTGMGYQAQPELTYHSQPASGHEMYVPHESEGVMSYQAMPGQGHEMPYVNEVETRANTHELPENVRR